MIAAATRILADNGPDWPAYVTALATGAAAIAAAFAAWVASRSTRAAEELVRLERERDSRAELEETWRQARGVMVEVGIRDLSHMNPPTEDLWLTVRNASDRPLQRARVKIVGRSSIWGPQLVGGIAPGCGVSLAVRLHHDGRTEAIEGGHDAFVRFIDAGGRAWIASARGALDPTPDSTLDDWMNEARTFAEEKWATLSDAERGELTPCDLLTGRPDWDAWASRHG